MVSLGGSFKDGFVGSLIGSGVSTATGMMFGDMWSDLGVIGRTAVSALSGGAASVLAGGKFADGAFSAAFFHLFNDEYGGTSWERFKRGFSKSFTLKNVVKGAAIGIALTVAGPVVGAVVLVGGVAAAGYQLATTDDVAGTLGEIAGAAAAGGVGGGATGTVFSRSLARTMQRGSSAKAAVLSDVNTLAADAYQARVTGGTTPPPSAAPAIPTISPTPPRTYSSQTTVLHYSQIRPPAQRTWLSLREAAMITVVGRFAVVWS
jgi:hypothetical protein